MPTEGKTVVAVVAILGSGHLWITQIIGSDNPSIVTLSTDTSPISTNMESPEIVVNGPPVSRKKSYAQQQRELPKFLKTKR